METCCPKDQDVGHEAPVTCLSQGPHDCNGTTQCVEPEETAKCSTLLAVLHVREGVRLLNSPSIVLLGHLQVGVVSQPDDGSWAEAERTCIVVAQDRMQGTVSRLMHCPKQLPTIICKVKMCGSGAQSHVLFNTLPGLVSQMRPGKIPGREHFCMTISCLVLQASFGTNDLTMLRATTFPALKASNFCSACRSNMKSIQPKWTALKLRNSSHVEVGWSVELCGLYQGCSCIWHSKLPHCQKSDAKPACCVS